MSMTLSQLPMMDEQATFPFRCLPARTYADKVEEDLSPDAVLSTDDTGQVLYVQEGEFPERRMVAYLPDHLVVVDVFLVDCINAVVVADRETAGELIDLQEQVVCAMARIRELLKS